MSTATPAPPVTSTGQVLAALPNGTTETNGKFKESSSRIDLEESNKLSEALAIREASDNIKVSSTQTQPPAVLNDLQTSQTPPDQDNQDVEQDMTANERATSPQELDPFDWDDFEARYDRAMTEAKQKEDAILNEFHELANYFGIWAAAASQHDGERALKRLRTREMYVQSAELSLEEKKRHYTQVVEAFKNALALLGRP